MMNLWLTITTPPVLIGIFAVQTLAQQLQEFGEASEEVFRGDRLPLI